MLTVKELRDLLDDLPSDFEVLVCGACVEVVFASKRRSSDPDLPNVVSLEEKACAIDPDNNDYAVLWTYDDEAVLS